LHLFKPFHACTLYQLQLFMRQQEPLHTIPPLAVAPHSAAMTRSTSAGAHVHVKQGGGVESSHTAPWLGTRAQQIQSEELPRVGNENLGVSRLAGDALAADTLAGDRLGGGTPLALLSTFKSKSELLPRRDSPIPVRVFIVGCVVVCCGVLQCVVVSCSELRCGVMRCSALQCVAVYCSVLQCVV